MSIINITTKIIAYNDGEVSSNPRLKIVDWLRDLPGTVAYNPKSETHSIFPGTSRVIFDGTLASTVDNTTAFDIALSTIDASRYRITNTAGTAPGFRTGRALTLTGVAVTFVVNLNASMTVTVPSGPDFTSVVVGDVVFIPHTTTGDAASVISVLNSGYWQVLGKTSNTSINLIRMTGADFEGVSQTVTLTTNNQLRAFSSAGLQIGNHIDISAGFSLTTRKTFEVVSVTDNFVEIISTLPLPSESGILPGASGFLLFSENKNFVYIETNQECAVRVNGDTGNTQRLSPPDASDSNSVSQYMRRGPTWTLTIVNMSPFTVSATVIHCE